MMADVQATDIWRKLRAQAIIEWKNEDVKRAFEEGTKLQGTAPPI